MLNRLCWTLADTATASVSLRPQGFFHVLFGDGISISPSKDNGILSINVSFCFWKFSLFLILNFPATKITFLIPTKTKGIKICEWWRWHFVEVTSSLLNNWIRVDDTTKVLASKYFQTICFRFSDLLAVFLLATLSALWIFCWLQLSLAFFLLFV